MICAIVLGAGQSKRMGKHKLTLPWGSTTVIGKVVSTLEAAGVNKIIIVCGRNKEELQVALHGHQIEFIFNQNFSDGEMLSSVKVGLRNIPIQYSAALIVLGDQPQTESLVIKEIIDKYLSTHDKIIVPSYQMHRGHPWLIDRELWNIVLELPSTDTLRDYLNRDKELITYISINNSSILEDLDTPEDYFRSRP